jgi:hypothetical protein
MATARDLIKRSMKLIGVLADGENPTASEQADALSVLNEMLKMWANDGMLVHTIIREVVPLVVSQQAYTVGDDAAASLDTVRPTLLQSASIEINGVEYPLDIITPEQYAEIALKTMTSTIPQKVYPEGTYPLETYRLWPVPSGAGNLIIYTQKPIATFATATDDVELPDGFFEGIRFNLAVLIAPEYEKEASPTVVTFANEFKAELSRRNTKPAYMVSDIFGLVGSRRYDINTGR